MFKLVINGRPRTLLMLSLVALLISGLTGCGVSKVTLLSSGPQSGGGSPSTPPTGSFATSNPSAENVTTNSAIILWTTNAPGTSQVQFGTTQNYGQSSNLDSTLSTSHSVQLSGLTSGTLYHFRVLSQDANGTEVTSSDSSFSTSASSAPGGMSIANVAAIGISATSATIVWTTTQPASSQVAYGQTSSYGSATPLNATLATSHLVQVNGLVASTAYHYQVISSDSTGKVVRSGDFTFSTAKQTTGLPTSVGWFEISNTALAKSGVCPPNYFNGDTYNFASECYAAIEAQSGGVADTTNNRLIVWGGGHNDYYGNEVYALDLSASPITWTRLTNPTTPTNCQSLGNVTGSCPGFTPAHNVCIESIPPQNPYPISGVPGGDCLSNGGTGCAPNTRHTYGNLAYVPSVHSMYAHSGVTACEAGGSGSTGTWLFDVNSRTWTSPKLSYAGGVMPAQGGSGVRRVAYDPNTQHVWLHTGTQLFEFDPVTGTYTERLGNDNESLYLSAVVDPSLKLLIMIGACSYDSCSEPAPNTWGVITYDISKPGGPYTRTNITNIVNARGCRNIDTSTGSNGAVPNATDPGVAYYPPWKIIVVWPNGGDAVYLFNPDPVNSVSTDFGQVGPQSCVTIGNAQLGTGPQPSRQESGVAGTAYGTYGRFGYFPLLDLFAVCNDSGLDCYLLRLR